MQPNDIPNLISVLRILLTIPIVWLLFEHQFSYALILFAVAGFSDGLDGFLAKRFGWQSHLGGLLDPLADKALLMSSFLVLGGLGLIPVWLVILVIFRDLTIMGGALYYNFSVEELDADPSLISKLNTLLQIMLVLLVVTDAGPFDLPSQLLFLLTWATGFTTLVSGIAYVWVWTNKARSKGWGG
ncbi:MAG: CDP-alcohol phosphatidyltransferase [gamma proteobacterium symbiont of Ctena orbiculata]|uniref:CDP-diacylglycerol--glycerol-3-phosphate 3-phosphatidyltransferase n=1 Tax=Candidatus Thiodiazotropha taylori TaxID=2792791 RepID=A0A944M950_9GAMM|nr:CDP-alcohol phosphatidyltransferase family protein [Candidatus Thiodiazotropha taylori]PUB86933.1 MAG: CDP-alcohol phosphatidyltransferase [gamma proteobacterium symbiont of Ctena orbiculata]MBT2989646.1 CDP-alcohol phosphatidyltransferase family protein [Candidatus Thiodiazotropha taylori]MBT2996015.1 CDP-alcohol phosphatidyltransferase family protein [Candidatus Thiodiazotropha taylori]MBT3001617.1 CDP-alcohol phosphatidyltransferase family protein [Candidatus Thiodiazotropha taylori]